jgi:DNA gyrase inhibitor GyrI
MRKSTIIACGLLAVVLAGGAAGLRADEEEPEFELLEKDGAFELRKYPRIPVASAPMDGMGERNDSFRKLFRYISGDNEEKQKIAMTAPVFMADDAADAADGKPGTMSFMLPAKVAEAGAPAPDGKDVTLATIDGGRVATLRFKGWRSEDERREAADKLGKWIAEKGWTAAGEPIFAFYDPPWTPEFMRRNEVWVPLR